jgi:hypothetical protein
MKKIKDKHRTQHLAGNKLTKDRKTKDRQTMGQQIERQADMQHTDKTGRQAKVHITLWK